MSVLHGMSLPVLYVKGSHYDVGYQIGSVFKNKIEEYFLEFDDLHSKFIPFYTTDLGKQVCNGFFNTVKGTFPQYVDEIKGIADGSGIPFHEVFLMQIRVELQTYMDGKAGPESSTLFINNKDNWLLAHNEDTSVGAFDKCYIVVASIFEFQKIGACSTTYEHFMAFCYPGIIPGSSFSCNFHGLVLTVNELYSKNMETNNMPRQFITRAMLTAKDPDHLMEILTNGGNGIATGCSVNMGFINYSCEQRMANIEICPELNAKKTLVDKFDIPIQFASCKGNYAHFNMYDHMDVVELDGRTVSSQQRQLTVKKMTPPTDLQSALNILGDESNPNYPLFRSPRKNQLGSTVATGVFDLHKQRLLVYMGNPKDNPPLLTIPFPWVA